MSIKLREMRKNELSEAARLIATTYRDDPAVGTFIKIPEEHRKLEILTKYFYELLRLGERYGRIIATDDQGSLAGFIIYYPPNTFPLPMRVVTIASIRLMLRIGFAIGFINFLRLMKLFSILDSRHPPKPHYYAEIGCVAKHVQKTGIARAMTHHIYALADSDGVGVYGETANAKNLPILTKIGYQILGETKINDLTFWSLWRNPK